MKKALSILIALALLIGTCSPVLSVFAKSEPAEQTKIAASQTPGKLASMLPEKAAKHEVKKLDQSKSMWEVVTGNSFGCSNPYSKGEYYKWIYGSSTPGVTYIEITFDSNTFMEWGSDSIEIYDDNDIFVAAFTGDQLQGKTITVIGSGFTLVYYSDGINTEWGFEAAIQDSINPTLTGPCGPSLDWLFDITSGDLVISGTPGPSPMDLYTDYSSVPWDSFRNYILLVSITDATSLSDFAFSDCYNLNTVTMNGLDLLSIGDYAFAYCYSLTSIDIPDSVQTIGASAFEDCEYLATLTIDSGASNLQTIGDSAFVWCYALTDVIIPGNVTLIGPYAFCESGITTLTIIGNNLQTIGAYAFAGCTQLQAVTLPNGLLELYEGAFIGCGLLMVTIPDSVYYIESFVFAFCSSLAAIDVDPSNQYFYSEDGVLFDIAISVLIQYPIGNPNDWYDIPNSVQIIGAGAFAGCMLSGIIIPDTVTDIGIEAFEESYSLTWVDLGYGLTTIGDYAFWGCENLSSAYFYGNFPAMGMGVFDFCGSDFTVYYIDGKYDFNLCAYPTVCMDGWVDIYGDGQWIDGSLPVKVKWFKSYKSMQLQLDFSSIVRDIDIVSWTSDNSKVLIDQNGYLTNIKTGARSANITVTITDKNGTEYSNTVKVVFYKYNWQLNKLQSQAVVSDKYAQRNLSVEEFEQLEQNEPEGTIDIMQYVFDFMNDIFNAFQKIFLK